MIRAFLAALALSFAAALPAHAWLNSWGTFGELRCTGKYSKKECLVEDAAWIHSGDGAIRVRIKEVAGLSKSKLQAIYKAQGVDWSVFYDDTYRPGAKAEYNSEKWRLANYRLRGLYTADGKTELLAPAYLAIYPFSDKVAVVKTMDKKFHMVTIGKKPVFSDIPFRWASLAYQYGGSGELPLTILFEAPSNGGVSSHHLMSPDGTIITTVENVPVPIERKNGDDDIAYFAFDDGLIGFPIKTKEGAAASVFVDAVTGAVDRIDDPLTFLRVHNGMNIRRYCNGGGNEKHEFGGPDSYWTALVKVGELPDSTGLIDRSIYMPLDGRGRPLKQNTSTPFVGMARIIPDLDNVVPMNTAWVFVYSDRGKFSYSVAGSVGSDILSSPRFNMMAENVALVAPQLDRVADIWAGYPDRGIVNEVAGQGIVTGFETQLAVRLFKDPAKGEAGGLTPWTRVRLCSPESITRQFKDISALYESRETGNSPLAVVSVAVGQDMAKYAEMLNSWSTYQERAAAREQQQLQAAIETARATMAAGENVKGSYTFLRAARNVGGSMLDYYWRDNRRLPYIEDASEICGRFGGNSHECRLVWPWAQGIYDQEDAAREAEAERYAAKAAEDRERFRKSLEPPKYVSSKPPEIRYCWRESGFWNC
jgi:hypothetical protein